ncbi:MAG: EamA family transporter [Syntrophus sp. (in: bacteria)]|nr:EamA family transporter [Syntrophus sp. (in: bacteria)]
MYKQPLIYIFTSAALFGISPPLAKLLVKNIPPVALAGFLYLGAFVGLSLYSIIRGIVSTEKIGNTNLKKEDLPWLAGAILSGGIISPICLMFGLSQISGFTTSLLLNLEGIFTAIIAVIFFKENAGKRLWLALMCMTLAGIFLTWDSSQGKFNLLGPLLITLSMIFWGIDNNLTRNISTRNPMQITRIKGLVSGLASISLAYALGMGITWDVTIFYALLLGSFSYGISLVFFIKALEGLGSFRTGMFFSLAPFIGAVISLIMLQEWIGWVMFPAIILTVAGVWLISTEKHLHLHSHQKEVHTHSHNHKDIHHMHEHTELVREPHVHEHKHLEENHVHSHWPDTHHRHEH